MGNKIIIFTTVFILSLFSAKAVLACLPIDWMYTMKISGLDINVEKLADLCTEETCDINQGLIAIRSHFDPVVTVIVSETDITARLDYRLSKLGMMISEMDYKIYDWKLSARLDLEFLSKVGVMEMENSEIKEISNLADYGKNIVYCQGQRQAFGVACSCQAGEEICPTCEGAMPLAVSLPAELMPYNAPVGIGEQEEEPPAEEEGPVEEKITGESMLKQARLYSVILMAILAAVFATIYLIKRKNKTKIGP